MKRGIPLSESLLNNENQYLEAFLGRMGGCLGETSALALLVGGLYLIYKKHIDWKVPAVMIGTVFVLTYLMGADPIMQILSGGLFLGAFFIMNGVVPLIDRYIRPKKFGGVIKNGK